MIYAKIIIHVSIFVYFFLFKLRKNDVLDYSLGLSLNSHISRLLGGTGQEERTIWLFNKCEFYLVGGGCVKECRALWGICLHSLKRRHKFQNSLVWLFS